MFVTFVSGSNQLTSSNPQLNARLEQQVGQLGLIVKEFNMRQIENIAPTTSIEKV